MTRDQADMAVVRRTKAAQREREAQQSETGTAAAGQGPLIEGESTMLRLMRDLRRDNRGVSMIEYALIAGLISVVAIGILGAVGGKIKGIFTTINTSLASA